MDKSPNWDKVWQGASFRPLDKGSFFANILDHFVPISDGRRSAIELGCFPGQFIDYLAQKRYVVSGVDTFAAVTSLGHIIRERGFAVGAFVHDDFRAPLGKFDLVLSLGFIEHFKGWPSVLARHADLAKAGGLVMIGCPNFASPLQRAMHALVDEKNLANHVTAAMYPAVWRAFAAALGLEIIYCNYIGPFQFWCETRFDDNTNQNFLQNAFLAATPWLSRIQGKLVTRESGYCLLVAKVGDSYPTHREPSAIFAEFEQLGRYVDGKDEVSARRIVELIKDSTDG